MDKTNPPRYKAIFEDTQLTTYRDLNVCNVYTCLDKTIKDVKLVNDDLVISFLGDYALVIYDKPECCEERYMTTDDDLDEYQGAKFLGIVIKEAPAYRNSDENEDEVDFHEIRFLEIKTSKGPITFAAHNEHNGHYSGINLGTRLEIPENNRLPSFQSTDARDTHEATQWQLSLDPTFTVPTIDTAFQPTNKLSVADDILRELNEAVLFDCASIHSRYPCVQLVYRESRWENMWLVLRTEKGLEIHQLREREGSWSRLEPFVIENALYNSTHDVTKEYLRMSFIDGCGETIPTVIRTANGRLMQSNDPDTVISET